MNPIPMLQVFVQGAPAAQRRAMPKAITRLTRRRIDPLASAHDVLDQAIGDSTNDMYDLVHIKKKVAP